MSRFKEFISKHSEIFNIRFGVIAAVLILCVVLLVTCRERPEKDEVTADPTPPVSNNTNDPQQSDIIFTDVEVTEDNIFEFLTLGQYKGIAIDSAAIGEQEIDEFIKQHLLEFATYTEVHDRAVRDGDIVIIDYSGSINGIAFEHGTDYGVDLEIGSNSFIPGFEEQIIGHLAGEQFDINVSFPDTYHAPELAGQDAVFAINLTAIYALEPPELTLDFIINLGMGFESIEDYREFIREGLEERIQNSVWDQIEHAIMENSVFHMLPNSEIDQHISLTLMWISYEAAMYGVDIEEYVYYETGGMSLDDFIDIRLRNMAIDDVKKDLVIRAVAVKEGVTITDEEFEEGVLEIVTQFFYESVEQFMDIYSRVNIIVAFLRDKLVDFLIENAVIN